MARKAERWFDVVDSDVTKFLSRYLALSSRELPIMVGATLELALLELIERRLQGHSTEIEAFLGTNGDGRAPAGSFGARIQLAYLLGLISEHDLEVLRSIKNIRNLFAHRVDATFSSPLTKKELKKLNTAWLRAMKTPAEHIAKASAGIGEHEEKGKGLFLAVFAAYHFYFRSNVDEVKKMEALSYAASKDA